MTVICSAFQGLTETQVTRVIVDALVLPGVLCVSPAFRCAGDVTRPRCVGSRTRVNETREAWRLNHEQFEETLLGQADKFPMEWWNAWSMLCTNGLRCSGSSGTRPICTPVTKDQLFGAGCMCDTALACLYPNKEGLYREFQSQEKWTSNGELWPEATAFPTKCS
ncbi:hypothetical protein Q8A67_008568 [Cirrhinus molitorella]|uniref:Uncharacterized protein n=1 Tax=Cirrhinus molitorella TaxID=172907 RepID=A0AA88TNS3_9TELE|nr:hypothetical protein Q8A67_008568 [Cirrhinus molitorella]